MMVNLDIKSISSLEKVLPLQEVSFSEVKKGSALKNEEYSYQLAFKATENIHGIKELKLEVVSDIAENISLYNVRCVPVLNPMFYDEPDENYMLKGPGMMPDVLDEYTDYVMVSSNYYGAVWVSIKVDEKVKAGNHNIKMQFKDEEGVWGESDFILEVLEETLPKLHIPYTNWFHCDCVASYYEVEPLSEKHWELMEDYIKMAADHGMNMILTPVFTPPLDTKVGLERPTVQLVDVKFADGKYTFGFEKLSRWLELCAKYGIEYLEISHLYSQWGAEHTPKIEVLENGELVKKFGWHTDSLGDEYKAFISQFIPALKEFLDGKWDEDKVYFHISDEPNEKHLETYNKIHDFIKPLLGDMKHMDAMSHIEYYENGLVDVPVIATTSIYDFLNKDIAHLWAYYCCGQGKFNLSNRFLGMSSQRNRVMGIQLYKFDMKGFLQWGYNFYYSQLSTHLINPYLTTESDGGFPAGDAFVVYPGRHGAVPSIRLKVFNEALQDLRALKLLEEKIGKAAVLEMIKEVEDFNKYPENGEYFIALREAVNEKLK
ncbi:MAG: DUF4091 domain-containing protein [Ruminococcaceae bacterium]|nr:DUF4091 domain-containing protein [Oscillospiraceae bacterium]